MAGLEYIKKYGKKTPIAWATLDAGKCHWVINACPYCGLVHKHGAGKPGQPAREFLGHRQAMCAAGAPNLIKSEAKKAHGYIICEAGYQ